MSSLRRLFFRHIYFHPLRVLFILFVIVVFIIIIFAGNPDKDSKSKSLYPDEKAVEREALESITKTKDQEFERKIQRSASKKSTFLFIMILTSPKGTERRDAIRNTWLKAENLDFTAKFIIGGKSLFKSELALIESENQNYKDMVIIPDLKDGYYELSNKVLHGFKWIDEHIDCSYIFKADDDSFVQVDKVISELEDQSKSKTPNLYWGFFRGNANVKRKGKWAETKWVLCDHYLPYANGGGYVLSAELVNFIARNWRLLQLYISEDVSVGAWLAPLKVHRQHDTRFDTEYRSRGCNNLHIVSHKQSAQDMYTKYEMLQKTNKLCDEEEEIHKSFEYDWNVPPSQCCKRQFGIP